MAMRFRRGWDFNPGNKQLDLNSLTQDTEVMQALAAAIAGADTPGVASTTAFTPTGSIAATDVQGAIVELAGDVAGWSTTLDGLTDVDTVAVAPTDGQTLVYDAASGLWKPGTISGGGGIDVGTWETKTVTLTTPAAVEIDLQGAPLTIGANGTRPGAPTLTFTVGAGDLVVSSDETLGHQTVIGLHVAVSLADLTGGSAGYTFAEVMVNGVPGHYLYDVGHAAGEKVGVSLGTGPVAVGDVVEIRLWHSADYAGGKVIWWARVPGATRVGTGMPPGGRYLYRRVSIPTQTGVFIPSTVLAAGSWVVNPSDWDTYNESVLLNAPDFAQQTIPNPSDGLLRLEATEKDGAYMLETATQYTLSAATSPTSITFDRLAIPSLPA